MMTSKKVAHDHTTWFLALQDGRKPSEVLKVEEELARLTRSTYPVAQLLQRPLPDGVDPTRLEVYLDPQHFQVNNNFHKTHLQDINGC